MTVAGGLPLAAAVEVPTGALDPDVMSRCLAPFLDAAAAPRVVTARLVAVAPGRRAVIAYRTAGRDGDGPSLIGKTYLDPQRARRLHRVLAQLSALDIGVPRPVAHLPGLRMSVFTASGGRTLDRLAGAEREAGIVAAARWLATLHALPVSLDRRFDLAAETHNLDAWARLVADRQPAIAGRATLLARRLTALAPRLELVDGVPIHKDFHYQHTLVEAGGMVVIDLDEARAGDPAFDVAHFAANLRLLALRECITSGEPAPLESAFLDAYASHTGYRCDARHRWFGAYTSLKIARQLACARGPRPVPSGAELERQVGCILEEGLRSLAERAGGAAT